MSSPGNQKPAPQCCPRFSETDVRQLAKSLSRFCEIRKGDAFIVKTIRTAIFPVADNRDLRPRFTEYLTIRLRKSVVLAGSGGLDFPVYTDRVCVTLLHQDKMKALQRRSVESADTSNRPKEQDQAPPGAGPAPILPPDV